MAALNARDFGRAEDRFRHVLRTEPRHVAALNLLVVALMSQRRFADALPFIQTATQLNPTSDVSFYNFGIICQNLNQPHQALDNFNKAIALNPNAPETWNNRGTIFNALEKYDLALLDFDKAISLNGRYVDPYINKAKTLTQLRRPDAALATFDQAQALDPGLAEVWLGRGHVYAQMNRFDDAFSAYDRALALKPDLAAAWLGRGNAFSDQELYDEAIAAYDKTLALAPDLAEAWLNRGAALQAIARFDDALASYDRAIAIQPDFAQAYSNRGVALQDLKRPADALASYDRSIAIKPDLAEAWSNRGATLQILKRLDDALASYDRAIALKPDYAEAYCNRGTVFQELKRFDDALASYDRAIAIKAAYAEALAYRGATLRDLKRLDEALAAFDQALAIKPDHSNLLGDWFSTKNQLCDWDGFAINRQRCDAAIDKGDDAVSPFIALGFDGSPRSTARAAQLYARHHYPANPALGPIVKTPPGEKIRIGYYSADFHNHATAYLVAELFELHDKDRFELVALSFGPNTMDAMRQRLAASFDRFIDVRLKSDTDIASLSRQIGIDIAVDLKGYTQDARTGIFAARCAPIQVNYLGFPGTMGADYMDYIIADKHVIPAEQHEFYSEKVVLLPNSYQVNDRQRVIAETTVTRAACGLPDDGFVFCCFNNNYQ
jgi:predicted O-linked N-acetylglucosamine transferase (SPINDLY family)